MGSASYGGDASQLVLEEKGLTLVSQVQRRVLQGVTCASHVDARFPELLGTQPRYHLLNRAGACLSSLSPCLMMPVGVLVTLITLIDSRTQYPCKSPGFREFPASTELCTLAQDLLLPPPISHNK